ncbi:MAG: hypothetical protein ACYCV4_18885 [Dermatophilaceae bacterium]
MELTCPDCGRVFSDDQGVGGNPKWRLAVHRRKAHGTEGKGKLETRVNRLERIVDDLLEHLGLEVEE